MPSANACHIRWTKRCWVENGGTVEAKRSCMEVSRTHHPLEMHPFNTMDSLMRSGIRCIKRDCSGPQGPQGNFSTQKEYLTCLRAVPSNYGPPVLAPPAPTPHHSDVTHPLRFPFLTSNKPQATDSEMSACSVPRIVPMLIRTCYTIMSKCCSPHNVYSEWPTWA